LLPLINKLGKLLEVFKLIRKLPQPKWVLYNEERKIKRYRFCDSKFPSLLILEDFFIMRAKLFQLHKDYIMDNYYRQQDILKEKLKFIEHLMDDKIIILNNTKR